MSGSGQDGHALPRETPPQSQKQEETRFLAIGQLLAPHGVRGEIRVRVLTDFPQRFKRLKRVFLGDEYLPVEVESARIAYDRVFIKLKGIDTPESARRHTHKLIYVPVEEAVPLEEGQFYWYQIVGLEVWTTDGRRLGKVTDILATGSNDVYVVQGPFGEVLVPAIEDVIIDIKPNEGRMTIELLEGMI